MTVRAAGLPCPIARPPRITFVRFTVALALVLMASSWLFVLVLDPSYSHAFFSAETASRAWSFLKELLGVDTNTTPAYLRASAWASTGRLALDTLAMSVLAVAFAVAGALVTFIFAARNVMVGDLAPYGSRTWGAWLFTIRFIYAVTRSVPELVWAMLLVFVLAPGILPGAVALAIHNFGILGKLSAEVVEGMDERPSRALRTAGAGWLKVMAYGVLPATLPRFVTYSFYRWEVIIRTTVVVGLVAAGGLGMEFRLSLSHFHYTNVTLLLVWYLLLVLAVDLASAGMRRLAR